MEIRDQYVWERHGMGAHTFDEQGEEIAVERGT